MFNPTELLGIAAIIRALAALLGRAPEVAPVIRKAQNASPARPARRGRKTRRPADSRQAPDVAPAEHVHRNVMNQIANPNAKPIGTGGAENGTRHEQIHI
jgi:hypothetical protein